MKFKKDSFVVLKTAQYLPKSLRKYAGQTALVRNHFIGELVLHQDVDYQLQTQDEEQIYVKEKHIARKATKADIAAAKELRGMPKPKYKKGDWVRLNDHLSTVGKVISEDSGSGSLGLELPGGAFTRAKKELIVGKATKKEIDSYIAGCEKRRCCCYKKGDMVRMLSAEELREKQLDYLPEALTEYQIQQYAGKVFTIEKTDKESVLLLEQGLWVGDWMIAGFVDSSEELRGMPKPKYKVGDVVMVRSADKLMHHKTSKMVSLNGNYCGEEVIYLHCGQKRKILGVRGDCYLVGRDDPECGDWLPEWLIEGLVEAPKKESEPSLTARIEALEKELAELKRRVG